MKLLRKRPAVFLVLACYALWLVGLLVMNGFGFITNRLAYNSGKFQTMQLTIEDFEWINLVEKEGTLISTSADPQLLLRNKEMPVDTLLLDIEYSLSHRVVTVFWAASGQDHSVRRMAYPASQEGTTMGFLLPVSGVQNLRIDPDSVAGNQMVIRSITVNQPRTFGEFFRFSTLEWVLFFTMPGLLASGAWLACLSFGKIKEMRKKGAKNG